MKIVINISEKPIKTLFSNRFCFNFVSQISWLIYAMKCNIIFHKLCKTGCCFTNMWILVYKLASNKSHGNIHGGWYFWPVPYAYLGVLLGKGVNLRGGTHHFLPCQKVPLYFWISLELLPWPPFFLLFLFLLYNIHIGRQWYW